VDKGVIWRRIKITPIKSRKILWKGREKGVDREIKKDYGEERNTNAMESLKIKLL
jgi:hypothetical protein